jgi:pyruvate dehydrogenase E2 component (dihydrolipoamide acetyltransferase)
MLDPFREVRTPERNYGPAKLPSGAVVTPLARRLAGEAGIDLDGIAPSGPHGRIVARDVEAFINQTRALYDAFGTRRLQQRLPAPDPDRIKALYEPGSWQEIPLDGMRRTVAAQLIEAKQTIPHFYLTADVAIERLNAVREEANAAALPDDAGKPIFRLSINDFIIKALALALARVPAANAVWAEDRILRFRRSDVGVAVAIEGGLLTPVIRGAGRRPPAGRDRGRRDSFRQPDDGDAVVRSPRGRRHTRRRTAGCLPAFHRASGRFDDLTRPSHESCLIISYNRLA